jgi:hypothetical protein
MLPTGRVSPDILREAYYGGLSFIARREKMLNFHVAPLFRWFCLISVCLVALTSLAFAAPSDDWVYDSESQNLILYYKKSSVQIDKQNNTVKVLAKIIIRSISNPLHEDRFRHLFPPFEAADDWKKHNTGIGYSDYLVLLDYKNWNIYVINETQYSNAGKVIRQVDFTKKWKKIEPNTFFDSLLNTILKSYGLKNNY